MAAGRLLGIARHDRPRGPMETLPRATVTCERGVEGDFRGALKPGRNKRQVTLMQLSAWRAALAELGDPPVDWWNRRVNLLVDGIELPRTPGARIRIGDGVVLEVTGETEPCHRMEEVHAGLKAALTPDWRGGVNTKVVAGGMLAIGDAVDEEGAGE